MLKAASRRISTVLAVSLLIAIGSTAVYYSPASGGTAIVNEFITYSISILGMLLLALNLVMNHAYFKGGWKAGAYLFCFILVSPLPLWGWQKATESPLIRDSSSVLPQDGEYWAREVWVSRESRKVRSIRYFSSFDEEVYEPDSIWWITYFGDTLRMGGADQALQAPFP